MTSIEVWATMRVTVDVEAVKREIGKPDPWPGDSEPQERTDYEIAEDYVNGESGATIDNHITIQEITTIEGGRVISSGRSGKLSRPRTPASATAPAVP